MTLFQYCPNWKKCDCDNCILYRSHKEHQRTRLDGAAAARDHARLADYILEKCPEEIGKGDYVNGESAAEIAIRWHKELKALRS
jgi:hypothetical protein